MSLGDQSKALRIVSKQKGWDPTEMIGDFDVAPDPWKQGDQSVGGLPGVPPGQKPPLSFANDHPEINDADWGKATWNAPDRASGSDALRSTAPEYEELTKE